MVIAYLGIGSNLGDRRKIIKLAVEKIDALKKTKAIKLSRIIETEPLGGPAKQGKFLNACLKINTGLSASELLKKLQEIERELGRNRAVRFGPRTIDLDILLYGERIIKRRGLEVPHPRMLERDFVLEPLLDLL